MSNNWVVNASPLVLLAKVGHIDLLPKLTVQLVIPSGVVVEINEGPVTDPARDWLKGAGAKWIQPDIAPVPQIAAWDLGAGETSVLSWVYQHRDFEAILDDRAARKCARTHNMPFRGTLGVVLAAKTHGLIPSAKPVFGSLVQAGLRIEPTILEGALKLVGEA